MKIENKGLLSFLSGVSIFTSVLFSVALAIMIIISGVIFITILVNPSSGSGLINSIYGSTGGNWPGFILMDLSLLLTLICSAIIAFLMFKVIKNVQSGIYFSSKNLDYFKHVLQCFSILVIINIFSSVIHNLFHINISITGSTSIQELGIIMWVVMYVIYIVFKQGLVLKNTNDRFI